MFKGQATKVALFAFDTTTNLPKTGDAANLTAYLSKDYGAVTALTDTSATEMDSTNAKGWYLFDVTGTEATFDDGLFTGKSSTANISVVGRFISTTPNRFTTLVIDAAGLADSNVVKLGPTGAGTAQTARDIGASVITASGTVTTVSGNVNGSVGSVTGLTASDVGAIKAKTDSLAFTVAGVVDANVLRVNGSANAGANLSRGTLGTSLGTVGAASTTTSIVTSSLDPAAATADQFKGRIVTFDRATTTANLRGQATDITASTAGGVLTVTALTDAPVSGDTFVIT